MPPILQIQDLRTEIALRRSVMHAVDGVSLSVDPGECLGIVGESGSGKTMTALSIMRLLPPGGAVTGGRITLAGTDIQDLPEEAMRQIRGNTVGMVFQDPLTSLNPTMTIGDQIDAPMFVKACQGGEFRLVWLAAEGRTRQGWAAPGGGHALIRSRNSAASGKGPGAAGGSFEGQHVCGSRLAGQAAPGVRASAAQAGVDLAGDVALQAADDVLLRQPSAVRRWT